MAILNNESHSVLAVCLSMLLITLIGCSGSSDQTLTQNNPRAKASDDPGATESENDDEQAMVESETTKLQDAAQTPAQNNSDNDTVSSVQSDETNQELPSLKQSLENPVVEEVDTTPAKEVKVVQTITIPESWKRLSPQHEIWVDFNAKQVIAAGNICMQAGPLEVFACPRNTKEHESVVSLNALGSQIHAALLAMGVEPGHPVKWAEKYEPARGPVINIDVVWSKDGKQMRRKAQEMVTNVRTGKAMTENWVFGGSASFTDKETGETYYYGDSGELVCLSNFSTATMDVPIKSDDANEGLLFEANTKNIPEFNTKVYLVFKPEIRSGSEKPEK